MAHPFRWRGRGTVGEYWSFVLVSFLLSVAIGAFCGFLAAAATQSDAPWLGMASLAAWAMTTIVVIWLSFASLSALVRRLHDTDRSGWWYWISLVPLIGPIWLLVLTVLPGDPQRNGFGAKPGVPDRPRAGAFGDVPVGNASMAANEAALAAVRAAREKQDACAEEMRALRQQRMPSHPA